MACTSLRDEWAAEQERLARLCVTSDQIDWCAHGGIIQGLNYVAGVDVSFFPDKLHAVAAVVVLTYPDMEIVYERCATFRLTMPYMVGFLAFREVPALKAMLEKIPPKYKPQVVLVDGNGVFHPRRCGSATHLGIVTGLPTIGVAKDVLKVDDIGGRVASQIASKLRDAGGWAPLVKEDDANGEPLAMLLRPSDGKKTLVVSTGHRVSLNTAVALTASLCRSSVPEPIRQADSRSRAAVRAWFDGVSLAKLKLGAGDLLDIDVPTMDVPASNEPVTKRPRHDRSCAEGRIADVVNVSESRSTMVKKKGGGHASKSKMVWKVKAAPRQFAVRPIENTSLESESTRTPTQEEESSETEMALFNYAEAVPAESLWRFLMTSLCGLCVARQEYVK